MSRKIRFKLIIKAHRKLKVKEKISKIRILKVNLHNNKCQTICTLCNDAIGDEFHLFMNCFHVISYRKEENL
jgi:hypothetical protein